MPVPAELRTERPLVRPWSAADAERLQPVLAANHAHLSPWIPARVADPATVPALAERLAGFAADFADAREWRYGLFTRDGSRVLGEVGLYPRDASGRVSYARADRVEVGYWLRADATGQGLATEAARAALDVADRLPGLSRAEIRCDARNHASAAVPRRLGFALAESWSESPGAAAAEVEVQLWTLPLPTSGAVAG
jgi:RimJ/RimL family protein N-acetyltransferase